MNVMCIYFNMTHEDDTKRAIFANRDFRIALSHAINRDELIDATMQRQGEPYQVAPLPDSPFYDEELATQFLDYDVGRANELLDQSFPERDGDGIRLGPDGEPIRFTLDFVPEFRAEWADMVELVRGYWLEVGIDANLRSADRSLFDERKNANQHDAGVWGATEGALGSDTFTAPFYFFPYNVGSRFAIPWAMWYQSRGEEGEEPPEPARRQMELFDQIRATADKDRQEELMRELLLITRDEF
jgi:peptide/nickel transport system substrate-binding protein